MRFGTNEERFWRKIDKTSSPHGCWIWKGARIGKLAKNGYGVMRLSGVNKNVLAHKFSYELHNGKIQEGMDCCHNCPGGDNRGCCNPEHLFAGTRKQNMEDAAKKNRIPRGENRPNSKLKESDVLHILKNYKPYSKEYGTNAFGKKYGVGHETIRQILYGRTWKHVYRISTYQNIGL